jgi:hypothetical protein
MRGDVPVLFFVRDAVGTGRISAPCANTNFNNLKSGYNYILSPKPWFIPSLHQEKGYKQHNRQYETEYIETWVM